MSETGRRSRIKTEAPPSASEKCAVFFSSGGVLMKFEVSAKL